MWFLGHFALGYFSASFINRYTREKIIIPVVWLFSIAPDIDEFFHNYITHRGSGHSLIIAVVAFVPVLIYLRGGWAYLAALASHILIGDFLVPPTQMFWPLSTSWFGAPPAIQLTGLFETFVEVVLFILMVFVIFYRYKHTNDKELNKIWIFL